MGDTANHLVNEGRRDLTRGFRFHHGGNAMRLVSIFRNHHKIWNAGISIGLNTLFPVLQPGVSIRWARGTVETVGGGRMNGLNELTDESRDGSRIACRRIPDSLVTSPIFALCYDVSLFIVLRDSVPILDNSVAKTIPRRDSIPVQTINRLSGRVGQYIRDGDWRGGMRQDKVSREVEKKLLLRVVRYCHRRVDVICILGLDGLA